MSVADKEPKAATAIVLLTSVKIILFTKIKKIFSLVKNFRIFRGYQGLLSPKECPQAYRVSVFGHSGAITTR